MIDKKVKEKIYDLESELNKVNAEREEALKYKDAYNKIKEVMQDHKCKTDCLIYQDIKETLLSQRNL